MGSQTLSILRQGVWASITGGWYYDPKQSHFSNVFHLYIWLSFLCLPFIIQLMTTSWKAWLVYCVSIGVLFAVIKLLNAYLHRLFDFGECVVEETSSHKSDDETYLNDNNVIEQNNSQIMTNSERKENIEMVVINNNNNSNINDDLENSLQVFHNSSNNNTNNNNNSALNSDFNERMACNNSTSVIDLEVDVHHRNSSGSSIGVSSERSKSRDGTASHQSAKKSSVSPNVAQNSIAIDNNTCDNNYAVSAYNLKHGSHGSSDVSDNFDALIKGTSLELGFMAQDPALMRAANNPSADMTGTRKRADMAVVRRARSELETTQCSSDKKMCSLPPSHPVSLEVIGTTRHDITDANTVNEGLRRTTPSLNDSTAAVIEQTMDNNLPNNSLLIPLGTELLNESSKYKNKSDVNQISHNYPENESTSHVRLNISSDYDEGDESDISLVVNYSAKTKKRKIGKTSKPRRTLNRRRVSKSCSSGKISTSNKKCDKILQFCDIASNDMTKRPTVLYSSESDIESHNGSDTYTSRSTTSLSSTNSSISVDETTALTSSVNEESENKFNLSISCARNELIALEPKCIPGPSKAQSHQNSTAEIRKRISNILSKNENIEYDSELKKLRLELQRRRKRTKRGEPSIYSHHNTSDPSELIQAGNEMVAASACAENGPPPYLLARILSVAGTHLAKSHEDTSAGAVHVFQDERGKWLTYTFDENSSGVARGLMNGDKPLIDIELYSAMHGQGGPHKWNSSSSSSGSTVVLDSPANVLHTPKMLQTSVLHNQFGENSNDYNRVLQPNANVLFAESFPITAFPRTRTTRRFDLTTSILFNQNSANALNGANISDMYPMRFGDFPSPVQTHKPKQYYKLWILPFKFIKVRFDRLTLLALLDRSLTTFELVTSILLALLVSIFGAILLNKDFFHDVWLVVFCLVIASSQYTLLKSVQPDAASPTHGYNRIALYGRPIYFCIASLILILSQSYIESSTEKPSFVIYGTDLISVKIIQYIREGSLIFLLSFPLLFSFGLLPQISTFLMYLFEQIDVYAFGGTAATMGLISATYSLVRSILAIALLYSFALIALKESNNAQNATFSVFCGLFLSVCYHLSRSSSDPSIYLNLIKSCFSCKKSKFNFKNTNNEKQNASSISPEDNDYSDNQEQEITDPLPTKLEKTVLLRLQSDLIICVFITIVIFAIHVSTIFTLKPYVEIFLNVWAIIWGFLLHYILNHFRKQLPWLCFAHPLFKAREYNLFEVKGPAKIMWFEKFHAWIWLIEKNVIYPLLFLSAITNDAPILLNRHGVSMGTLIVVICGFKCLRSSFNDSSHNYIILLFTYLFFKYDFSSMSEPFLLNYFVLSIAYFKIYELLLKVRFVVTYVAPWQITWGSAFHAFAQPFSVPHSAMLFLQAVISSVLSAPLQPILGSAIFFASYVRPIKFWERDYNTKRVDHSNTRLASQLERAQLGSDDNNLNSIFYEHLTRSLQHSLYGDLLMGRWGAVSQGDCFVLASDNLNCLVHIIELGNGLVTFQVRGLEFRGTYCQQREVEAISEGVSEDEGCCCCEPGHLPGMLSINAAFNQRWLSWEVTHIKYVLEGYSISDNSALTMLQPYDLRKALITYYIKSIIYYCSTSKKLEKWMQTTEIKDALDCMKDAGYVDVDPIFNASVDEDYDFKLSGITRSSFCHVYHDWIQYCMAQRNRMIKPDSELEEEKENFLIALCYCLSLVARRALSAASHHNSFTSVEFLLFGLHALFKGDFRITSSRDEWVFQDMDLLRKVIAPSVRMALKLHQDHFMSTEEYEDNSVLFDAISNYRKNLVISHEADPIWRNAVLSNVPSLLALRHVFDDGTDQYKIIMLNKRYLSFRVIKINRECVRGLWAGQQQELIYLRNRNPERGSIQNAKQALRNIINSSCDQPIGYPIYVSPLTTSFAETNEQLSKVIGYPISFGMFKRAIMRFWKRLRTRCGEGCSSGGTNAQTDFGELSSSTTSCRRIESFALERVRSNRGSNYSETSSEYDSNQFLCRRSRTQPHPLAYRQYRYSEGKINPRQASTLVNLTAFRPIPQQSPLDAELEAIMSNTPRVITDKSSSPLNSKGELV